jgi:ferric-dicitrate binding protein FerR (iron transport regulator)
MKGRIYTIEELMLDDSFVNYCLSTGAAISSHWKTIIRDNPEQEEIFDEAKSLVLALHGGLSRPEVNRQIEEVRRQLLERKNEPMTVPPGQAPSLSSAFVVTGTGRIKRNLLKIASSYFAITCLVLIVAWWFLSRSGMHSGASQPLVQAGSFQSQPGQRKTVSLPDGSVVVLNANSSISWAEGFNKNKRNVRLTGDAFFNVAKNANKPFTVLAGDVTTTALGTGFYVHGKAAGNIRVDLLEGKVSLSSIGNKAAGLVLLPGETAKAISGVLQKTLFDSAHLRSWIGGRISFNETPALTALKQLETWYAVKIVVNNKQLKDRVISGDYENDSLQDILKVICFSVNSRFSLKGDRVIIE